MTLRAKMLLQFYCFFQNLNFRESSNTVVSGNVNVANQINVMMGAGKKRRRKRKKREVTRVRVGMGVLAKSLKLPKVHIVILGTDSPNLT